MGREYEYDESGIFGFFILSLLAIYLIPATYFRIKKLFKGKDSDDAAKTKKGKKAPASSSSTGLIIYVVALVTFCYFAYSISHVDQEQVAWNPYDILEIETGASEVDIKSAYKKLSLQWHPDKNKGNEEFANLKFVDIAKAYKALTNEEAKENWEKYGNPDGKMEVKVGIALPKWLVQEYSSLVLLAYIIVLVVIIVLLGRWWSRSKKLAGDDILEKTEFQLQFRLKSLFRSKITKGLIMPFTQEEIVREVVISPEFQEAFQYTNNKADALPPAIEPFEGSELVKLPKELKHTLIRAAYLLDRHLNGGTIPEELREEHDHVVGKSARLLKRVVEIGASVGSLSCCQRAIELQQMVVQGVWDKDVAKAALKQLPGAEQPGPVAKNNQKHDKQKKQSGAAAKNNKGGQEAALSFSKIQRLSADEKKALWPTLDDTEFADLKERLAHIPQVQLIAAKFFVLGEEGIYVEDYLTLRIRFAVWYGEKPLDMDEVLAKYPTKDLEKEEEPSRKKIDTTLPAAVNAPLFPESRNHSWWILLAEAKGVVTLATLKETALKPDENFTVLDTSFRLRWPKVGKTNFTLHVQSDSYLDVGFSETVVLNQQPRKELPELEEESEEEIEEDTSSLSALLGKKKEEEVDSDSDLGSDSEEDK